MDLLVGLVDQAVSGVQLLAFCLLLFWPWGCFQAFVFQVLLCGPLHYISRFGCDPLVVRVPSCKVKKVFLHTWHLWGWWGGVGPSTHPVNICSALFSWSFLTIFAVHFLLNFCHKICSALSSGIRLEFSCTIIAVHFSNFLVQISDQMSDFCTGEFSQNFELRMQELVDFFTSKICSRLQGQKYLSIRRPLVQILNYRCSHGI